MEVEQYGKYQIRKEENSGKQNQSREKSIRSAVKTAMKKVDTAVANKDLAAAQAALPQAVKAIEMAASKGVYHKNNAARKVSRISKAVNSIA